jgi:hypothetical protein
MKSNKSKLIRNRQIDLSWFASRSKNLTYTYIGFGILWLLNCLTIMKSHWAGDDWPNSQTPYWIQWRYGSLSIWNVLTEALFWNSQWMNGAGRFYPIHWIESRFIFSYLREHWEYKLYQTTCLALAGFLFAYVVYVLSKSHTLSIVTIMMLSLTVQFRRDFDPHIAFAVMLPSLLVRVLLAILFSYLAAKSPRTLSGVGFGFAAGILYFMAMSTYEFGFLLFPTLFFAYLIGSKDKSHPQEQSTKVMSKILVITSPRFMPILVSWAGYGIFVFGYLRPNATSISGSYVLGLSWKSIPVFISQSFMGLPVLAFRAQDFVIAFSTFVLALIVFWISKKTFDSFSGFLGKQENVNHKVGFYDDNNSRVGHNGILLGFIALNLILAPGLMMSMQPSWWDRADLTHSYLGVMMTEFGTALLLSILLLKSPFLKEYVLVKRLRSKKRKK